MCTTKTIFVYRYLHGTPKQKNRIRLRRSDGKLVFVTRKRLNELAETGRLVTELDYERL